MASPFRTFRKNQKVWMAALTIMAMFAFVVLGNQTQCNNAAGRMTPPAVRTKFGNLTQGEIVVRKLQRDRLSRFFQVLAGQFDRNSQPATASSAFCEPSGTQYRG